MLLTGCGFLTREVSSDSPHVTLGEHILRDGGKGIAISLLPKFAGCQPLAHPSCTTPGSLYRGYVNATAGSFSGKTAGGCTCLPGDCSMACPGLRLWGQLIPQRQQGGPQGECRKGARGTGFERPDAVWSCPPASEGLGQRGPLRRGCHSGNGFFTKDGNRALYSLFKRAKPSPKQPT